MAKNDYVYGQNAHRSSHQKQPGGPMGGMGTAEKPRNFKETWGKLLRYCQRYWSIILIALVCAAAGAVLGLLGPGKLSDMTDLIQRGLMGGIDLAAIGKIGITLAVIYGVSALLSYIQGYIMATVTQRYSKSLRTDISRKINRLPMWYYNKTTTGDVLSRVTNDVDTIGQSLNMSVGMLVTSVAQIAGALIMMLLTNVLMTVAAVVASLLGFGLMLAIMGRSQKHFSRQQKYLGRINGHVEETYAGYMIVKAYNGEEEAKTRFEEINGKLRDSAFKAQFISGMMMPIMSFIGNLGYVAVCVVGAVLTMNGSISFGVIVAFMLYIRYFTQPLAQTAQAVQSMQSAAAAGERVFEFLEAEEMADESGTPAAGFRASGAVEFKHVRFGYEDSNSIVIHDFSAAAQPGQKIAIVGPTGAERRRLSTC